jgi:hypothetical protein
MYEQVVGETRVRVHFFSIGRCFARPPNLDGACRSRKLGFD